jgi:hypothetical protein
MVTDFLYYRPPAHTRIRALEPICKNPSPPVTRHRSVTRRLAVEIESVLDRLNEAGVSVWLDSEGKLRIDKDAMPELKELVREHKQALIDVKTAVRLMNAAGIRVIRLPPGHFALAYRLGTDLELIRGAMKVLRKESMPLVINDEGLRPMTWDEWKLRRPVWTQQRDLPRCEPEKAPPPEFGRKTA